MSHEEQHSKATGDYTDGCSPGGALWEIRHAGYPYCCGEERWRLEADASWRGCRAEALWEV